MISVRLLECLTPIMQKMEVISAGSVPLKPLNHRFSALLEERISKRDGNSAKKLIRAAGCPAVHYFPLLFESRI